MSVENHHLKEAKMLYQKALEEFEKAKENNDGVVLRDACAKGWLSTIEATYALLVKKGVHEEELPISGDRGRRYMINKYADGELRFIYFSLRDNLHIMGYYDGALDFEEMEGYLDDLKLYIQKVEELEE
jgi:hypothetical protein